MPDCGDRDLPEWYSARLRFLEVIERRTLMGVSECVFLFRAIDFEQAREKALLIGGRAEKSYPNANGELLSYVFAEILTLDWIENPELDGAEINCSARLIEPAEAIDLLRIDPAKSTPGQTL